MTRDQVAGRYSRNLEAISANEQNILLESSVLVVGCGGLGGYVIEELTRIGIGSITVWDGDRFEESNLNRQLLAQSTNLGVAKVQAAVDRIAGINQETKVKTVERFFTGSSADMEVIAQHQVVVDALDTISARLTLAKCCCELKVPMVHGAVAGWWGQVAVIMPGDRTLEALYKNAGNRGCEQTLGNLVMTVALVASLQAAQTIKLLLGRPYPGRGQMIMVDLQANDMQVVDMTPFLDTIGDGQ